MPQQSQASAIGPVVVCVRGPSRSGKTALIQHLVPLLSAEGYRVAYIKRTHHALDLPEKASGRVWASAPAAMLMHAPDRLQLTVPPGSTEPAALLADLPVDVDLVLFETHTPEPFPTVLSCQIERAPGESIIGRWKFGSVEMAAVGVAPRIAAMLPADTTLDHALRTAMRVHGGHACAGLVLGTRLAIAGAAALGIDVPDVRKRLIVTAEMDRCAVDALQAVTGCRPGKRTLRLLDYGKLAATFVDQWQGRAVRVAARGDLRDRVGEAPEGLDRHDHQRAAYLAMTLDELFAVAEADPAISQFDLPGPPRRRVNCARCGEEVADGRDVLTDAGPYCRPCAGVERHLTPIGGAR